MENTVAVILAAGEGKRMKSKKPKVLHEVLFKPMIDWVLDAVYAAGIKNVCVVIGSGAEQVKSHLQGRANECFFAEQGEQLGTGHAVMQAASFIKETKAEDVIVLNGDAPFINAGIITATHYSHKSGGNAVTVLTAKADDPTGYGRIVRDDGCVSRIVEEKDASPEQKRIKEINSGAYWFMADALTEALSKLGNDNAQKEYYLTDTVKIIGNMGYSCGTFILDDMDLIAGANDRHQLMELNEIARNRIIRRLFEDGVSINSTDGVIIGPDATIGSDTEILPGTIIRGRTKIGHGCVIGPNSLVDSCIFDDKVLFNASQAYNSSVGKGATIGPFTQLRPNSILHDGVHVGDFVEIKNSEIGKGTKVAHLTYVGDSDVGGGVNFGCGVVTVNYDGLKKSRTKIGDNAFIGCNTNLVAPVEVGNNAYTAAGSTITKDVPEDALAVARSRQQNIEGWVARKRGNKDTEKNK